MRLNNRDRLGLRRFLIILVWLGLYCWALYYSQWLAAAVWLLLCTNSLLVKYWYD